MYVYLYSQIGRHSRRGVRGGGEVLEARSGEDRNWRRKLEDRRARIGVSPVATFSGPAEQVLGGAPESDLAAAVFPALARSPSPVSGERGVGVEDGGRPSLGISARTLPRSRILGSGPGPEASFLLGGGPAAGQGSSGHHPRPARHPRPGPHPSPQVGPSFDPGTVPGPSLLLIIIPPGKQALAVAPGRSRSPDPRLPSGLSPDVRPPVVSPSGALHDRPPCVGLDPGGARAGGGRTGRCPPPSFPLGGEAGGLRRRQLRVAPSLGDPRGVGSDGEGI